MIAVVAISTFAAVVEDWAMAPDEQPFAAAAEANLKALRHVLSAE